MVLCVQRDSGCKDMGSNSRKDYCVIYCMHSELIAQRGRWNTNIGLGAHQIVLNPKWVIGTRCDKECFCT